MKKISIFILLISIILSACNSANVQNESTIFELAEAKVELLELEVRWKTEIEVIKSNNNIISLESRDIYYFDDLNKNKIIQYVSEMENIISPPFLDEPSFSKGVTQNKDSIILYMRINYADINPEDISQSYYDYCFPKDFINENGDFNWDEYLDYLDSLQM